MKMVIPNTVNCNLCYALRVSFEYKTHVGLLEMWPVLCLIVPYCALDENGASSNISKSILLEI